MHDLECILATMESYIANLKYEDASYKEGAFSALKQIHNLIESYKERLVKDEQD